MALRSEKSLDLCIPGDATSRVAAAWCAVTERMEESEDAARAKRTADPISGGSLDVQSKARLVVH